MDATKWLRLGLFAAAMGAVTLVGCGDDDDNNGGGTPRPTATAAADTPTPGGNPTATPDPDDTPAPTATPGGSGVSTEVQAFVGSVVGSLAGLADIANPSGGGAAPVFPITAPCNGGGTVTINCGPAGGGIRYELGLDQCDNPGSYIDGDITLESGGNCLSNPFPTGSPATLTFVGDIETENPDTGAQFEGTMDSVSTFTVFANGDVEFSTSGSVSSDCIGGTATFDTTETIFIPSGGVCPTAGEMSMSLGGENHQISYDANGVTIDGETFDSCEDVATCN